LASGQPSQLTSVTGTEVYPQPQQIYCHQVLAFTAGLDENQKVDSSVLQWTFLLWIFISRLLALFASDYNTDTSNSYNP